MVKKKKEETYQITFKGLLYTLVSDSLSRKETDASKMSEDICNGIELYLRRHYWEVKYPAIVLTEKGFEFVNVEKE
jgi:hypothetical protein